MPQDKQHAGKRETEQAEELPAAREKDARLAEDVDAILDDIDEVIGDLTEEEARAFVDGYVQKGGQ